MKSNKEQSTLIKKSMKSNEDAPTILNCLGLGTYIPCCNLFCCCFIFVLFLLLVIVMEQFTEFGFIDTWKYIFCIFGGDINCIINDFDKNIVDISVRTTL